MMPELLPHRTNIIYMDVVYADFAVAKTVYQSQAMHGLMGSYVQRINATESGFNSIY